MIRFCVVHASDQRLLKCAVASTWPGSFLEGTGRARIGVAYYNGDEVLLIRRPTVANVKLGSLLEPVTGNKVLVAIDEAGGPRFSPWSVPPYRYRNYIGVWSIDQVQTPDFTEQVLLHVPEYLAKEVKVGDPGELFYYLVLSYLHDMGKLNHRELPEGVLSDAVLSALRLLPKLAGHSARQGPPVAVGVVSNGKHVVAGTVGGNLWMLRRNGIEACPLCSEADRSVDHDPRYVPHPFLKAVALAFVGPDATLEGFERVSEGQVVTVTSSGEVATLSVEAVNE